MEGVYAVLNGTSIAITFLFVQLLCMIYVRNRVFSEKRIAKAVEESDQFNAIGHVPPFLLNISFIILSIIAIPLSIYLAYRHVVYLVWRRRLMKLISHMRNVANSISKEHTIQLHKSIDELEESIRQIDVDDFETH